MIDTHAHLHSEAFKQDRPDALRRAFAAGLRFLLEVNIDARGWPRAVDLAAMDPRVYLTVGIHPHDTGRAGTDDLDQLAIHLNDPKVRAVGETGLDYFRNYAPHDLQRSFFTRQVAWARETGLPLVVHSRQAEAGPSAHQDVLRILHEEGRGQVRGVFHCYSGDLAMAREVADLGFRIGVGGGITYNPRRSGPLLGSISQALGTGIFLLETDCPYLTPHPHRNERNEPANIPVIAEALARYLALPVEEVERITDQSAIELFRLGT
jgi:TatD DNase family protein